MVNYFIYAKDYSGSTSGDEYYHKTGLETFNQFQSDVNKMKIELKDPGDSQIVYLHWACNCVQVDEEITIKEYENFCGNGGGTYPETIIEWIKENIVGDNKIQLLYIVTDGLIDSPSVEECMQCNENMHYENVVFHGINRQVECIDLSVAVSFLKSHCTIYRNNEQIDDTNISEEFDYSIINIDNFTTEKENLKSYIKLKYINSLNKNTTALSEIDSLKQLRNRLFASLLQKPITTYTNTKLDTKDKNIFVSEFKNIDWYKCLNNPSYDLKVDIEKSISTLINYITCDKKSYAFDVLKFETKFSNEVVEEPIVDVNFTTDQEIEFPDIILDDEKGIPVILFTELNLLDKLIFNTSVSTASFSKFRSLMECPLFLLYDPDLNESIGYFYTLNVYKQLLENTTKTEPRSRRPFHGGLVLVDTDDFDRYNDYILSATYFNFKMVKYNVGLFYYVLWKICEKKQWMDKNVIEQFKRYMLRRVSTTVCKIGLSSLPLDPQVNTSLPTALWYCVELSSDIFKNDSAHFAHERLRMYYGIASYMIEILNNLQYTLDLEAISNRRDLIRHVMTLKKIPTEKEKVFYLLEKIFKSINGFLVSEIENPQNVKKLNYLKLNHKEMLSDDVLKKKVNLNDYVYTLYHLDDSEIPICDKTFRPFFMINYNTSFYSKLFEVAKKVEICNVKGKVAVKYNVMDELEFTRVLSFYKLYLNCVKDCKRFPTLQEYMDYILKKKKFKDNLVNVFAVNVCEMIENIYLNYEKVTKGVDAREVVKVSNEYANRIERIKAENVAIFGGDNEIREFIFDEEAKYLNLDLNKTEWTVVTSQKDKNKKKSQHTVPNTTVCSKNANKKRYKRGYFKR